MKKTQYTVALILSTLFLVSNLNAESVELQFWDMIWGPPEYSTTAAKLVDKYNATHPGVVVKYQATPWNNWYQTFATAIASGTAPDLSTGASDQAFQFSDVGAILPIDDVVASLRSSGKADDFVANSIDLMKYKGHYVAVPWQTDINVIYYRIDLFKKAGVAPPRTWTEYRAALKRIDDKKSGVYGLVIGAAGDHGVHNLFNFMFNNGGGVFDKDRNLTVKTDRNKEALEFLSNLVKDGSINPASAGYSDDDALKAFASGKAATIMYSAGFDSRFPELKENIGILDPLTGPHGDKGIFSSVNNIMLYSQSKHPKETKDFLLWYLDNNLPIFTEGHAGSIPVRKSFVTDPYFTANPFTVKTLTYIPVGKAMASNYPGQFPELNEIDGDGTSNKAIQNIILGKPVDGVLNDMDKGFGSIMSKAKQ